MGSLARRISALCSKRYGFRCSKARIAEVRVGFWAGLNQTLCVPRFSAWVNFSNPMGVKCGFQTVSRDSRCSRGSNEVKQRRTMILSFEKEDKLRYEGVKLRLEGRNGTSSPHKLELPLGNDHSQPQNCRDTQTAPDKGASVFCVELCHTPSPGSNGI